VSLLPSNDIEKYTYYLTVFVSYYLSVSHDIPVYFLVKYVKKFFSL
jgi:hypothetical protein